MPFPQLPLSTYIQYDIAHNLHSAGRSHQRHWAICMPSWHPHGQTTHWGPRKGHFCRRNFEMYFRRTTTTKINNIKTSQNNNTQFGSAIHISLTNVPVDPIDKQSAPVQVMVWRRTGDKPVLEPMLTKFTKAYLRGYVTSRQRVNSLLPAPRSRRPCGR